jgi:adenylate cyclase
MARRLSAILAADVVNYSKLMSENEADTLAALKAHRSGVFDPNVSQYGGRIVKLMGDGALVEFPSVVDAVQCALAIQKAITETGDQRILLRIGVNLGDIIIEGDDIYGNGVNVAVRLQQMADPGGICISGTVFEQIDGKVDYKFADLGSHQIKNISKPIRVYGNFSRIPSTSPIAKRRPFFDTADDKSTLITGGCLCGDVRYEISKPAIDIGYCHCRMCQRFSGAPVIFGATYPIEAVQFTQGEPTYYKSSLIAERGFCKRCGSSLTYKPLARRWTDWILIMGGTLDRPENFTPVWHLGVESQMPWLVIEDDLPRVRCDESPSLVEAWANATRDEESASL